MAALDVERAGDPSLVPVMASPMRLTRHGDDPTPTTARLVASDRFHLELLEG